MRNNTYCNVLKGDPGKLFKGHSFNLTQETYGESTTLTLVQNYFNSQNVISTYSVNDNTTNVIYTYYPFGGGRLPQWFQNYCKEIAKLDLPLNQKYRTGKFELVIMSMHAHVSLNILIKGLAFKTHSENIDTFAEIRYEWGKIRHWLKNINLNELLNADITTENQLILPINI